MKPQSLDNGHSLRHTERFDNFTSQTAGKPKEYTYATQGEFEACFQRLGLRVLASTPIRNPWIVKNRFREKFELWDTAGCRLDDPPTNYVIVGQKVAPGDNCYQGIRLIESQQLARIGYLEMTHYRNIQTGRIYDLARRPNTTIDILPWFERNANIYVLARRSYPRPIVCAKSRDSVPIDGCAPAAYLSEPLNAQQGDKPLGQTVEELLAEFEGVGSDGIICFETGSTYYPSPGGLQEQVCSVHVQIHPVNVPTQLANRSGFGTSGHLRAIESRQALRAAQVGGLPECRLERNIYELLLRQRLDPGPWIGEAIELPDQRLAATTAFDQLADRPNRRLYRRVSAEGSTAPLAAGGTASLAAGGTASLAAGGTASLAAGRTAFLDVRCARFDELNAANEVVASGVLEFVVPHLLSTNTVAIPDYSPLREFLAPLGRLSC